MAKYKILADNVTGINNQTFWKGDVIDGGKFIAEHIPELIKNKCIAEDAPVEEKAATQTTPQKEQTDNK